MLTVRLSIKVIPDLGDEVNISSQALRGDGLISPFPPEKSSLTFCQYRLAGMVKSRNLEDKIYVAITEDQNFFPMDLPQS